MVEMVDRQPHPHRLDSVDSVVSDETDSASPVSSDWNPMLEAMSWPMADFVERSSFMESRSSDEKVREVASELALDLVRYTTGERTEPANRYCDSLRRICDKLFAKHEILFTSLVRKLNLTEDELDCRFLENVADQLFSDGQYNWGRIVTFYAFSAWLARHCVENHMNPLWSEQIADKTGKLIAEKASNWIIKHGGWDAMADIFEEPVNMESKIWKGLLYTVLGLGALATTVAVVR